MSGLQEKGYAEYVGQTPPPSKKDRKERKISQDNEHVAEGIEDRQGKPSTTETHKKEQRSQEMAIISPHSVIV